MKTKKLGRIIKAFCFRLKTGYNIFMNTNYSFKQKISICLFILEPYDYKYWYER